MADQFAGAALYGYLPRLVAEYTPVESDYHPVFIHPSSRKGHSAKLNFAFTEFSEVQRFLGALSCFVPWRTYTPLRREYDAFVTWPAEAA